MTKVTVREAKTHLGRLLRRVSAGEEIVIARAGKPIARLVPAETPKPLRVLGADRGKIRIADGFDAPLPPDIQAYFEGEGE
jgi:prevent-host-death family protein